jgi:hypothetical protein
MVDHSVVLKVVLLVEKKVDMMVVMKAVEMVD